MTTPPDARPDTRPIVVKLGGSTLGAHDTSLRDIASAARDGLGLVVVHGGGSTISAWLERAGIEPKFERGLRVTDAATLEVVVAVLAGVVNTRIVAEFFASGVRAIGLTGADGLILQAYMYDDALGFVGKIYEVNPQPIKDLLQLGYVPIIAPIALDDEFDPPQLLNTNADTAAGELAAALHAQQLVFLTDVEGVLDAERNLLQHLTAAEAAALIESGVAAGGMIPKLEAAVHAASAGCATHIIDGTRAGVLAAVFAGAEVGTTVSA